MGQSVAGGDRLVVPQSGAATRQNAHACLPVSPSDDIESLVRDAFARDLQLLATLNDREPTAELLEGLRSTSSQDWFSFKVTSEIANAACTLLDTALDAMPYPIGASTLDELAGDYAAIYLIHSYRAPPTESPWLDKDQLERQEPMFEVAAWYRRYGLGAQDRQLRSDDHMVLQLQFLSYLFSAPELDMAASASEAARFLDQHLLRWISNFAERVAARCQTPYYCGVVTLTDGYLQSMRDYLAERYHLPRPVPDALASAQKSSAERDDEVARYMPGVAPSW